LFDDITEDITYSSSAEDIARLWRELQHASKDAIRDELSFSFDCTNKCWCRINESSSNAHHRSLDIMKFWAFAVMCNKLSVSVIQCSAHFYSSSVTLKSSQKDHILKKEDSRLPINLRSDDARIVTHLEKLSEGEEKVFWVKVRKNLQQQATCSAGGKIWKTCFRNAAMNVC
jgi:hypothetical protein